MVRAETNTSHVEEYGDLDIGSLPVAYFQGHRTVATVEDVGNIPPIEVCCMVKMFSFSFVIMFSCLANLGSLHKQDAVDSRDVPLEILKKQYEGAVDRKTKKMLQLKIRRTQKVKLK